MQQPKELLIVAGPNGSGKTTFALGCVAQRAVAYLSADAIAGELAPEDPTSARIQAGRRFLTEVNDRLSGSESLVIETTLSGVGFRRILAKASRAGFVSSIVYICLDSPETCVARVEERARKGGHFVPPDDVRRRFRRSIRNFWTVYRQMADSWVIVYNGSGQFQNVAAGSATSLSVRDSDLFTGFLSQMQVSNDG